jgi:hypothetical protein
MSLNSNPPIIFIGMHRSGTSLLGRLLEQLGLFVGDKKDENNEAVFFQRVNQWLMAQCGARWDNPEQVRCLWQPESEAVLQASENYAQDLIASPRAAKFLGIKSYLKLRSIEKQEQPWGWKDPLNTFTLPFWLQLFPEARVIFIERHGVDVAESLRVRAERSIDANKQRYDKLKPIAWALPKRRGFSNSPRSLSLEGGFSLWRSYQEEAVRQFSGIENNRIFRIQYEDLLSNSKNIIHQAADFCNLSVSEQKVREITNAIDPSRAFPFRKNTHLQVFAEKYVDELAEWGY